MDNATCHKAIAVLEEIYKKMKEAVSIIESDKTDRADGAVQGHSSLAMAGSKSRRKAVGLV